jgi:hypothetical protein
MNSGFAFIDPPVSAKKGPAMPDTRNDTSGPPVPADAVAENAPPERAARAELSADQVNDIEELIDLAEKIAEDPVLACEMIQASAALRLERHKEWRSAPVAFDVLGRSRASSIPTRSEGATPMQPISAIGPRRPYLGFDREREAYARAKGDLLIQAEGRFVVFVGDESVGPFDDFRSAYVAGRRRFGPGPLYIRQVLAEEPVFEPIGLEPCPS